MFWGAGRSVAVIARNVGAPLAPLGDAKTRLAVLVVELTPVPPLATATIPVTLPAVVAVAALVAVAAVVAEAAFPFRLAVIVPAEKLPLASREAKVFAVFTDVALVFRLSVPPRESAPPPVNPPAVLSVTELFCSMVLVTPALGIEIVPELVIGPPVSPAPVATLVTVPLPVPGKVWPAAKVMTPVRPAIDNPLLAGVQGALLQNWKVQFGVVPSCAMIRNR